MCVHVSFPFCRYLLRAPLSFPPINTTNSFARARRQWSDRRNRLVDRLKDFAGRVHDEESEEEGSEGESSSGSEEEGSEGEGSGEAER